VFPLALLARLPVLDALLLAGVALFLDVLEFLGGDGCVAGSPFFPTCAKAELINRPQKTISAKVNLILRMDSSFG
jgi:hypothetical protein